MCLFGIRWYTWDHQRWFWVWGISFSFKSQVRALNDPSHPGSGWHIGSEVWVSFALGFLDHYLHHNSHHIVTCFDLPFLRWVVLHCHTLLHLFPSLFLHFLYLHSLFVSSLFIFSYPRRSSSRFMNDEFFGACHLLFDVFLFRYMVESPHSHGSAIFDITHTGVWHYLFGDLGLCFPSFHSHFTPGLHYGPSHKTTLRPWGLVFALMRFIRTGFVYWLSMGCWQVSIPSGGIEGHILSFHSVYLP